MHPRIEHDAAVRAEIEQVGVRADFIGAGQVGKIMGILSAQAKMTFPKPPRMAINK
jgi:hypothetical protein